jgi:hypothetical protein
LAASGAPVLTKFSYDKKFLYIGVNVNIFDPSNISKGSEWQKNDGIELAISGVSGKDQPATYVLRIFPDGTIQSLTLAGVSEKSANLLRKGVRCITAMKPKQRNGGGWICELAMPFEVLGIKPFAGTKIPFNLCAWCNEYGNWHCWEGTQEENWNLEKAGVMELK